jgi:heat shock protein HslJ
MRSTLALIAVSASLLGGCATAPAGSAGLAGTNWTILRVDGAAPVVPEKASLKFEDERLSAHVGCNGIGGDYRVDGVRLIAGPLMATRMFCAGPVWQQEEAVNALLSAAPEIERRGRTMRLVSGGHALDLELAAG